MEADELDKIGASLNSATFDSALISALTLWRRTRDSDVADLVDAIADKLDPKKTPTLPRSPKDAVQEAWMKLAKKAKTTLDPEGQHRALQALLPMLYRAMPIQTRIVPYNDNASKSRIQSWRTRLSALTELKDDPRMTSALIAFLRDVPFEMGDPYTGRWLYDPAIELCERLADKRAIPHLQSLIDSPPAKTQNLRDHLLGRLPRAIDAIIKTATTFEAVSESLDRKKLAALRDQLGITSRVTTTTTTTNNTNDKSTSSEADLIHQIVTAKTEADADAARAVLIDSWLERGDPRGELATTTDEKRQRAIIRAHDKEWVGPDLARVLELRTYRHGLLDSARLASTSAANAAGWTRAASAPQLATLRSLDKGQANEKVYTQFLTSPVLLSINEVTATSLVMLKTLASRETSQRLRVLTLESMSFTGGNTLRVLESPNFAGLRKIRLKFKRDAGKQLPIIGRDVGRYLAKATRDRLDIVVAVLHAKVETAHSVASWLHCATDVHPLAMGAELGWHPDSIDIVVRADAEGKLAVEIATWATAPFVNFLAELRKVERLTITAKGDKPLSKPDKLAAAIQITGVNPKNVTLPKEWKLKASLVTRKSK